MNVAQRIYSGSTSGCSPSCSSVLQALQERPSCRRYRSMHRLNANLSHAAVHRGLYSSPIRIRDHAVAVTAAMSEAGGTGSKHEYTLKETIVRVILSESTHRMHPMQPCIQACIVALWPWQTTESLPDKRIIPDHTFHTMPTTQALVETAMLAAVSGLAYLVSTILKIENTVGYFLPLPIVLASMRSGAAAGWKTMMATAFLLVGRSIRIFDTSQITV